MAEWNQCWYCGVDLVPSHIDERRQHTIDELIARSRGGRGGKMVTACKGCNNLKGESSVEDFKAFLQIEVFYGEQMGWQPW